MTIQSLRTTATPTRKASRSTRWIPRRSDIPSRTIERRRKQMSDRSACQAMFEAKRKAANDRSTKLVHTLERKLVVLKELHAELSSCRDAYMSMNLDAIYGH